jgi:hypothetical protein
LSLSDGDVAELRKWIALSGAQCVARVAAALTRGESGNVTKPHFRLLLEMAHRLRADPHRTAHDVATEVAADAKSQDSRNNYPAEESLITTLGREFRRERTKWYLLAKNRVAVDAK